MGSATRPSSSTTTTPARRLYHPKYFSASVSASASASHNPFERPSLTLKFVLIALASAVPAFFLGTTVSFYLSLPECQCDHYERNHNNHNNLPLVESSSLSTTRRQRSMTSGDTKQQQQQQRPATLPLWVEDVVQERLQKQQRNQQAMTSAVVVTQKEETKRNNNKDDDEQQERPDTLPSWVEDVVMERLDEERQYFASQLAIATNNIRTGQAGAKLLLDARRVGNYITGLATTPKANFTSLLDLGVPLDAYRPGSTDVLMIYSNNKVLPRDVLTHHGGGLVQLPAEAAVEKCDYVSVILTDHNDNKQRNQCLAIVPQFESYHIQRWGRFNAETKIVETGHELQLIPHGTKKKGRQEFRPPNLVQQKKMFDLLRLYLKNVEDVQAELKVILERIAVNNTVIVMVCNFGQSELLVNFVCAAHARGFDISNILVFTTDQETDDLARGLGLATYYDHRNFDHVPKEAAGQYGDARFTAMMLAKVISVQLVSMLGYDLLFSDVDIVWFKHPLEFFQGPDSPVKNHDVIFQDDGSRTLRYAPWSANSGFYFVRHNDRTMHFLTSLLMRTNEIFSANSHQKPLVTLMTEHVTLYGLRAKVISKAEEELPGGFHYNQKSGQYMRDFYAGKVHPYIFHMSWTLSKDNKLKYLRQMGEWYVHDACIQQDPGKIGGFIDNAPQTCCSAEPLITCHYRDKPSKIPCRDSPNIDQGRPSFWP